MAERCKKGSLVWRGCDRTDRGKEKSPLNVQIALRVDAPEPRGSRLRD